MIELDYCAKCGKPLLISQRSKSIGHWFTKKTVSNDEVNCWFHETCHKEVFGY